MVCLLFTFPYFFLFNLGIFCSKIFQNVSDAIRLLKFGAPLNLIVLAFIIYLGPKAGVYHWAFFAVSSVFLSLSQPAVGMAFHFQMLEKL